MKIYPYQKGIWDTINFSAGESYFWWILGFGPFEASEWRKYNITATEANKYRALNKKPLMVYIDKMNEEEEW